MMYLQLVFSLCLLTIFTDAVRLIRENGFRENTYFYHLGDGGHAYHFSDETTTSLYFKCVMYERGCHGRAVLRLNGQFRHTKGHNHEPDPDLVGERHFRENVLNVVRTRRFVSYSEIVEEARSDQRYNRRVTQRMTLRRLRCPMYRERMKKYPAIPQTLRQLTRLLLANPDVAKTQDNAENLYAGSVTADDGSHHVAFASPRMLHFMSNITTIQSDGTFRSRPAMPSSSQLFVIVCTWRHCVIPLVWVIMESRTLAAYRAVFRLLKDICPNFNPRVCMTDWEHAQQRAWQEAFPNVELRGCLWHLCRAFVKKVKALGLLRYRMRYPGIISFIRKACAIPLLPRGAMNDGLRLLRNAAMAQCVVSAYLLHPFFDYIEQRWLNNANRRLWMSLYKSKTRTNNACESHNRRLREKTGSYRPNLYKFIESIAFLENESSLNADLLHQGENPRRPRRWQSVFCDNQLVALSQDLEMRIFHNMEQTILNFLGRASHLFHNAFDDLIGQRQG